MGRKRPWSQRAKSRQPVETIEAKHAWKHATSMVCAGMMLIMTLVCTAIAVLMWFVLSLLFWYRSRDESFAPGLWEHLTPPFIFVLLFAALALIGCISYAIFILSKRRLKPHLIPIRCHRCPVCFYDLSSQPRTQDICPECGTIAPRRECIRIWCQILRSSF